MTIRGKTWLRVTLWLLVVIWMGIIFWFSAQKAVDSDQTSGEVVNWLIPHVDKEFDTLPLEKQPERVQKWTVQVRKSAHFILFAGMGALSFAAFSVDLPLRKAFSAALALGAGWAILDEVHQLFVPGRSCEFGDMCVDGAGVLLGTAVLLLILLFVQHRKNKKA